MKPVRSRRLLWFWSLSSSVVVLLFLWTARPAGGSASPPGTGSVGPDANETVDSDTDDPVNVVHHDSSSLTDPMEEEEDDSLPTLVEPWPECGLWWAPSSLGPQTGWGVYAGRAFAAREDLLRHPPASLFLTTATGDVVLPLVDEEAHCQAVYSPAHFFCEPPRGQIWFDYQWNGRQMNMHRQGHFHVQALSLGLGSLMNSFIPLANVEIKPPQSASSSSSGAGWLSRATDPGAGASTPYYDQQIQALIDIEPGQELLVSYGPDWFQHRTKKLGALPRSARDYDQAQEMVALYQTLARQLQDPAASTSPMPSELIKELWKDFVHHNPFHSTSRILNALRMEADFRQSPEELLLMLRFQTLKEYKRKHSTRDLRWLQQHGTCTDHLRGGPSQLASAGMGAFTVRALPKDAVVAPLPVMPVLRRDRLRMYHFATTTTTTTITGTTNSSDPNRLDYRPSEEAGVMGVQLMINYCFGHEETTLLLCPYGSFSHVNHNQTLANVKLQWADPQRSMHNPQMLQRPLSDLRHQLGERLALELVATRDLKAGEEIFLDYGAAWERAWLDHVQKWRPVPGAHTYTAAWQLNQDQTTRLRTQLEQSVKPYPPNIEIRCDPIFADDEWEKQKEQGKLDEYTAQYSSEWWRCDVLLATRMPSNQTQYLYKVKLFEAKADGEIKEHIADRMPRQAIHFVDRPYTSDIFLENAFRHEIGLPDEMLPAIWRNRPRSATQNDVTLTLEPASSSDAISSSRDSCGLWWAPSTLQGAGMGVFAGQDFESGELLDADGAAVVPLIDAFHHYEQYVLDETEPPSRRREPFENILLEYVWSGTSMNMGHEGLFHVSVFASGLSASANSFLPLVNVAPRQPEHDWAGLHRSKDPGAGAFTPYHSQRSTAKHHIHAGDELFMDYGSHWFRERPFLGAVPLKNDLEKAEELRQQFTNLTASVGANNEALEDAWDTFVRGSSFNASTVLGMFHEIDLDEWSRKNKASASLRELYLEHSRRSLDWLAEHGVCGDHLRVGGSSIPQAGRGAFTRRRLTAGTVVAPMPLVHVTNRERWRLYRLSPDPDHGGYRPNVTRGIRGYQLLLNYCLGHAESTLLLCPYGPTAYVNHQATRANVGLQWADPRRSNHDPAVLNQSVEELGAIGQAALAMELIALRDLEPGEEIFLDYGDTWEQAWQAHVQGWTPVPRAADYISAAQLNADQVTPLRTRFDQSISPYPQHVEMRCNAQFLDPTWEDYYVIDQLYEFLGRTGPPRWWPCQLIQREAGVVPGEYFYAVRLNETLGNGTTVEHSVEVVPRQAMAFFDRPYTSDMFLENAFRHEMGIPDHLFPSAWRNKEPRVVPPALST